jgi:hypothetical protein
MTLFGQGEEPLNPRCDSWWLTIQLDLLRKLWADKSVESRRSQGSGRAFLA